MAANRILVIFASLGFPMVRHEALGADRLWERGSDRGVRGQRAVKHHWPRPSRRLGCPPCSEQLQQVVGEADDLPLRQDAVGHLLDWLLEKV